MSKKTYKYTVNGTHYESETPTVTGAQIRTVASIPADQQLFQEEGGQRPDLLINPDTVVDLAQPGRDKFYSVPPANFGAMG